MKALLGLYILLWGFGLTFDPRLQDYKILGIIGGALLVTGVLLVEIGIDWKWHWPWEFFDREMDSRITTSLLVVICLLIGFAVCGYYYFYPVP